MKHPLLHLRALFFTLCFIFVSSSVGISAQTRDPIYIGDGTPYADLNAAMASDDVIDGDVLRVKAGTVMTTSQDIYKKVTIEGPGWAIDSSGTLKDGNTTISGTLTLMASGIRLTGLNVESTIFLQASNIVIDHCYLRRITLPNTNYNVTRVVIKQNFILGYVNAKSTDCNKGWEIINNIFGCVVISSSDAGGTPIETNILNSLYGATIANNSIDSHITVLGNCFRNIMSSTVRNNIVVHRHTSTTNVLDGDFIWDDDFWPSSRWNHIKNNIFSCASPNDENKGSISSVRDIYNVPASSSFTNYKDTSYRLSSTSVAKGYATDGGDCGAFGGDTPYEGGVGYAGGGLEPEPAPAVIPALGQTNYVDSSYDDYAEGMTSYYGSLQSLFTAISTFDINTYNGSLPISVMFWTNGTMDFDINATTASLVKTLWENSTKFYDKETHNSYITICNAGSNSATINITTSQSAMSVETARGYMYEALYRVNLKVNVLFNGEPLFEPAFEMDANDLAGLKTIFDALGGANWTNNKWNFDNNGTKKEDFPGVTFKDNRVISIMLNECNLRGKLPALVKGQLDMCDAIYMRNNAIEGDVSPFLDKLYNLKAIDLDYNRLTEASLALPKQILKPSLGHQMRTSNDGFVSDFWSLTPIDVPYKDDEVVEVKLPTFYTIYDGAYYDIMSASGKYIGYLKHVGTPDHYNLALTNVGRSLTNFDDEQFYVEVQGNDWCKGSAYPVRLVRNIVLGDADLSGTVDVLDAQWTLRYILAPEQTSPFSFDNANTYSTDQIINVQDIVCTVNIILDNPISLIELPEPTIVIRYLPSVPRHSSPSTASLITSPECLSLAAADVPVAAVDMLLTGVRPDEVSLALPAADFMMMTRATPEGTRVLVLSPTGRNIVEAGGETTVLLTSAPAVPQAVLAASPMAKAVSTGINTATGISATPNHQQSINGDKTIFNLAGQRLTQPYKGINIVNGRKVVY